MAADDLGQQVELQQQMNKLLQEQARLTREQITLMGQQSAVAKDICSSLECVDLSETTQQTTELTEGLEQAADSAGKTSSRLGEVVDAAPKIGLLAGAFRGFVGGIKGAVETLRNLGGVVFDVAGTIARLSQTILATPFNIWKGLIQMSQRGGVDPLREALEELRGEFGSLATNEGKMLKDSVGDLRSQMGNLAGTGLSMSRVFGYGREGLATFLKLNAELATALGSSFNKLQGDLAGNTVALAMYRKGLGLTAEQQAKQMKMAHARGKSVIGEQTAFASMAIQMGKAFDTNAKVVAKSMAAMQDDVSSFGHMSVKSLGASAVYAQKLGLEVEDLKGIFDKFNNFESAATGAAEMAQAFGMNVDAMALIKAESPAQVIDELRQSFFSAGQSMEGMSRHQRKLLEQQTSLTGAALDAAFANENMSLSYEDIEAAAEEAEGKQLTQAEAMKELSDSIQKLVKSGEHGFTGFFDAFVKGFEKGIMRSKDFRKLMRSIQRSLRYVYRAGIRVGRMFVKFFPGIQKVFEGLQGLFNPKRWKKLSLSLSKVFKTFFNDLKKDPEKAIVGLMNSLEQAFKDHLGSGGSGLKKIGEGMKAFGEAISGMIAGVIPMIKDALLKTLETIFLLVADVGPDSKLSPQKKRAAINLRKSLLSGAKEAAKGSGGFVSALISPIYKALTGNPEVNKRLKDAFIGIVTSVWKTAEPHVLKAVRYMGYFIIIKGLLFGMASAVSLWFTGGLIKLLGGGTEKGAREGIKKGLEKAGARMGPVAKKVGGHTATKLLVAIGAGLSADRVDKAIGDKMFDKFKDKGGRTTANAAMAGATVVDFFTLGLLSDASLEKVGEAGGDLMVKLQEGFDLAGFGGTFKGITKMLSGLFETFSGIGGMIKGVFTFDWKSVKEGFQEFLWGMPDMFLGAAEAILSFIPEILVVLAKAFLKIGEWVLLAIPTVVGWFYTLGKGIWEAVSDPKTADIFIDRFWETVENVKKAFKDAWNDLQDWMDEWAVGALKRVKEAWGIKSASIEWGAIALDALAGILGPFRDIPKKIGRFASEALESFGGIFDFQKAYEMGMDWVNGLIDPLKNLPEKFGKLAGNVRDSWRSFWKSDSPSKVMMEEGENLGDGVLVGMKKKLSQADLQPVFGDFSGDIKKWGTSALGAMDSVLDMPSNISAIAKSLQEMQGVMQPMMASVAEVKDFTGGELKVSHNLPNTKIEVNVSIDSKKLAGEMATVNIGKDNAAGKTFLSAHTGAPSPLVKR
jgi:hypothetical protein